MGVVVVVVAQHRHLNFAQYLAAPIVHDYSVRPSPFLSPIFTSQRFRRYSLDACSDKTT